jgi:4-hydroxybenzoate polyprenyltransferase
VTVSASPSPALSLSRRVSLWLRLGRVSNLPTVWSNVLAALVLAGAAYPGALWPLLGLAFSAFYVGGMYLNDAFDRDIDRRERPGRPIPSGQVSARAVFAWGFAALAAATAALGAVASLERVSVARAVLSGAALAALIVFYDAYHKRNPLSPVIMGACRVMVYVAAAASISGVWKAPVLLGAGALWCHLIGLTYAAKQEAFNRLTRLWPLAFLALPVAYGSWLASREPLVWPFLVALSAWLLHSLWFLRRGPGRSVPSAVVRLIAGISLLDAVLIAGSGAQTAAVWALVAVLGCGLSRVFQRYVPGT